MFSEKQNHKIAEQIKEALHTANPEVPKGEITFFLYLEDSDGEWDFIRHRKG